VPTIPTPSQFVLKFLARAVRRGENKRNTIQIGKEIVKLSLFTDNMILYLKDLKNSTQNLIDTMNSFREVAGYKLNFQKLVTFLYTNNEQIGKKYRKIIPFKIASKNQIYRNKLKNGCK
jgi:hypothetical protein